MLSLVAADSILRIGNFPYYKKTFLLALVFVQRNLQKCIDTDLARSFLLAGHCLQCQLFLT